MEKTIASPTSKVYKSPELQLKQDEGIYLFCFAHKDAVGVIEGPGVDNRYPVKKWALKDVIAVLSKVNLKAWTGPATRENLNKLGRLLPQVCRYEKVIEQTMQCSPVWPAQFMMLFPSLESLRSLLDSNYDRISGFLDYMADKEEWTVKGMLDKTKAEKRFFHSSSMFSFSPLSPGSRHLLEQRLRAEAAGRLESWLKIVSGTVAQELQHRAVDSRKLGTLPQKASRGKDVVFDWAFLLDRETREDFCALAKRISVSYSQRGLTLKVFGPRPPYNFCPDLISPNKELPVAGIKRCICEKQAMWKSNPCS